MAEARAARDARSAGTGSREDQMDGVTAVLDIGKTNVQGGDIRWRRRRCFGSAPRPIAVVRGRRPIPTRTSSRSGIFSLGALAEANKVRPINAIVATTHGCAAALIDDSGLVLAGHGLRVRRRRARSSRFTRRCARRFRKPFRPPLPAGLNLARQLAWQKRHFPEAFARAKYLLTYPQYWAWRLAASRRPRSRRWARIPICGRRCEGRLSSVVSALGLRSA